MIDTNDIIENAVAIKISLNMSYVVQGSHLSDIVTLQPFDFDGDRQSMRHELTFFLRCKGAMTVQPSVFKMKDSFSLTASFGSVHILSISEKKYNVPIKQLICILD